MLDLEKKVEKGEEREREMVQQRAWDRIQMENQVQGRIQDIILTGEKSPPPFLDKKKLLDFILNGQFLIRTLSVSIFSLYNIK